MCIPLPFCPNIGFGMNDATSPNCCATCFTTNRNVAMLSAVRHRVGVAEVDLVLAVRDFVVRGLHFEPHLLEHVDDRAARLLAEVHRREVEVAADVVRRRRRPALAPRPEQEELRLHPGVHRVAELRRARDLRREHAARIAVERLALRAS